MCAIITFKINIITNPTEIIQIIPNSGEVIISGEEGATRSGDSDGGAIEEEKFLDDSGEKLTQVDAEVVIVQETAIVESKYEKTKVKENFDLIVFGAEPEGIAAAVRASRLGLKTLMVTKKQGPRGLFTYGMLNTIDMNTGTVPRVVELASSTAARFAPFL